MDKKALTKAQQGVIQFAREISLSSALETNNISYITKLLALVNLPYKNPNAGQFSRKNGNVIVTFTNTSGGNLPYGRYPRLIIIWLITQVIKKRSQVIDLGDSLNQFMEVFGLSTDGRTMKRFKEQAINLFDTNIHISKSIEDVDNIGFIKTNLKLTSKSIVFWGKRNPEQIGLFNIQLELTYEFYNDILSTAFPIDTRAVKALSRNISLDLYIFLASRIYSLNKSPNASACIPLADLHSHIGANYRSNLSGLNNFQKDIKSALLEINTLWPELNYRLLSGRLMLMKSSPHIPPLIK